MKAICTWLLAVTVGCASMAHADGATIYGVGSDSCLQWTEYRTKPDHDSQVELVQEWILGWLSAISMSMATGGAGNYRGELRLVDASSIAGWLDKYCVAHPQSLLQDAARVLEFNLIAHDARRENRAR